MDNIGNERNEDDSVLFNIRHYSSENFDKQIVFISSGALLISMGFMEKIVDISEAECKWLLVLSWVLFALSLISNLISHKTALHAVDARIEKKETKENKLNSWTDGLNYFSIGNLLFGLILLIIFVSKNI